MKWNTGRQYSADGQIIEAVQYGRDVMFIDRTRNICGSFDSCKLDKREIMRRYDAGDYRLQLFDVVEKMLA